MPSFECIKIEKGVYFLLTSAQERKGGVWHPRNYVKWVQERKGGVWCPQKANELGTRGKKKRYTPNFAKSFLILITLHPPAYHILGGVL